VSAARPYREPARVEPDPPPAPKPAMERIGPLRKVHAPPPFSRALAAPVIVGAFVVGLGLLLGWPWWLITPFALAAFALLGRSAFRLRGVAVELHAEGLVLCRKEERTVRLDGIPHPTVFLALLHGCVRKVRVDDLILVPFATSTEQTAALAAQGAEGTARRMFYGGFLAAVGVLTAVLTYSKPDGTFVFGWGLILWGAVMFFRALQAYLSDRDR
jgi:hypothetical protein